MAIRGGTIKTSMDEVFMLDELAAYLKVDKPRYTIWLRHVELAAFKGGGTWRFR